MINHLIGADTRIDYNWTDDDGTAITPTAASFEVTDSLGASALTLAMGEAGLVTSDLHALELHLDDEWEALPGLYSYKLRVKDSSDWAILSAGLLRIR